MDLILSIITNTADILILAFVIYKLLVMLKDNRAMQLIKGLAILLIAYYISGWLKLETIHYLLSQSWSVLLIGVIIIFQPELRTFLEYLGGKGDLFNPRSQQGPKERLIGELLTTLEDCSRGKTGVLLVLEGKTGLKDYVTTGTAIDAAISSSLLENLFFKNSPLHDGAVIIKGNRIAAAGCIMPLTDRLDLDAALGTRHRAAVGVTEVSDCLALVVSEENGSISVAQKGKIYPHITINGVERLIREFYAGERKKKEKSEKRRKR